MSDSATASGKSSTDPLSSATRSAKRNLLAGALLAITFRAFDVPADRLPLPGLSGSFDRAGAVEFLLFVFVAYSLLTFTTYYYIDIKNFPRPHHQEATERWRSERRALFIKDFERRAYALCASFESGRYHLELKDRYGDLLHEWTNGGPSTFQLLVSRWRYGPIDYANYISVTDTSQYRIWVGNEERPPEEQELKARGIGALAAFTKTFALRHFLHNVGTFPRSTFVRSVYVLRNYGLDGVLPIFTGVVAALALFNLIDIGFLATWTDWLRGHPAQPIVMPD